jgi:hypothetical protein
MTHPALTRCSPNDVQALPPERYAAWNDFIRTSEHGTIFHTTQWLELIAEVFNRQFSILCINGADGILAGLPLTWKTHLHYRFAQRHSSTPYTNAVFHPSVLREERALLFTALLQRVEELCCAASITSFDDGLCLAGAWHQQNQRTYRISLDNAEEVYQRMDDDVKRRLRGADKAGLQFSDDCSPEDLFRLVTLSYRQHAMLPPFGKPALLRYCAEALQRGLGRMFAVRDSSGAAIAAALVLIHKDTCYGSLLGRAPSVSGQGASQFLIWNLCQLLLAEHEVRCFDLCGGNTAGIEHFNLSLGAECASYRVMDYHRSPFFQALSSCAAFAGSLKRRTTLFAFNHTSTVEKTT